MKENQVNIVNNQLRLIDDKSFLKEFSFDSCMTKYGQLKNAKDAFLIESPSFYSISRQFGENFLKNYLKGWLIELNENFNFTRTQNESQINRTVLYIVRDFGHFKISEWFLFITKVERGMYGPYYESIDISKIYSFLREYELERIGALNKIRVEKESNSLSIKEMSDRILGLLKNKINVEDFFKKIE